MNDLSVKAIRQDFKNKGIFYTPPALAEYLKSLIDTPYKNVYDPTCGRGNLLSVFEEDILKFGQDISEQEVAIARDTLKNFQGVAGDTLKEPAFMNRRFDCIVANPPFSVSWEEKEDERFSGAPCLAPKSKADYAFLLHILYLLSEEGTAAILSFPGILYRQAREGKIRRYLVEKNVIDKVIHIPPKQFTDTSIATCILVFKKNRQTTDIEFIDTEKQKQRKVTLEEIRENHFNLSVNYYIQEEREKIEIDPVELEMQARKDSIRFLCRSIEMSMRIAEMEGMDVTPYLDELEQMIAKYKNLLATDNHVDDKREERHD
ncbi:MAG: N-6 DNA methylase [Peptostreptococcaceae bacterium]|nr:N-6 DNA methylase [Peptostreptococcaceae bacterium]